MVTTVTQTAFEVKTHLTEVSVWTIQLTRLNVERERERVSFGATSHVEHGITEAQDIDIRRPGESSKAPYKWRVSAVYRSQ